MAKILAAVILTICLWLPFRGAFASPFNMAITTIENLAHFETEVLNSKLPVLIEFCSQYGGQAICKDKSTIESLSIAYAGRVKIAYTENLDLAREFSAAFPSFALFQEGNLVDMLVGDVPYSIISQMIDGHGVSTPNSPIER